MFLGRNADTGRRSLRVPTGDESRRRRRLPVSVSVGRRLSRRRPQTAVGQRGVELRADSRLAKDVDLFVAIELRAGRRGADADASVSLASAVDREWLDGLVQRCLGRLRSEHQDQYDALKEFILEDRPQAEIADALGVTAATIRKRVWRGKRNVAAYLREEIETYALSPNDAEEELRYLSSLLGPLASAD